ncbi:MAG: cupin domain-containing protein [Candidatus Limnocylindrales bacterium]
MEIRRFGPGHRRPDGPPGTTGLSGQSIHSDERGVISELAFSRHGVITPHSNPNLSFFIVISGGGFVQVGDERTRVNHGEAVVWPPDIPHGAYTDGSEMRAIVIELPAAAPLVVEGEAVAVGGDGSGFASPAAGSLAERRLSRDDYDVTSGEPW